MAGTTTLVSGLHFSEGPRWRVEPATGEGRLWYSDFYSHAVHLVGPDGDDRVELDLDAWIRDRGPDGSLSGRRAWADFSDTFHVPDGICIDAEGAVWVTIPFAREVVRVTGGGEITDRAGHGHRPRLSPGRAAGATPCAIAPRPQARSRTLTSLGSLRR